MSETVQPAEPGEPKPERPGALRRRASRERRLEAEVSGWWKKPGVLVFLGALLLAAVGWGLLIRAARRLPVEESTIGGIDLRLEEARWIEDEMDHGDKFQKPAVMMPDLPAQGSQRVTVFLAASNRSAEVREFHGEEFFLVPEIGGELPPIGAVMGEAEIDPGQTLNTALHFDLDTRSPHGKLLMEWRRDGRTAFFAIPDPSRHDHLRPRGGDVALPPDARLLLPIGNPDRGEDLYAKVYGCAACHGDPKVPGSNNVGPHLGRIGALAGSRVAGMQAPQYIYQSIIDPDASIAPDCKGGPCAKPTAMPDYSSLVSLQDAADLLTYLLELKGSGAVAGSEGVRGGAAPGAREGVKGSRR